MPVFWLCPISFRLAVSGRFESQIDRFRDLMRVAELRPDLDICKSRCAPPSLLFVPRRRVLHSFAGFREMTARLWYRISRLCDLRHRAWNKRLAFLHSDCRLAAQLAD